MKVAPAVAEVLGVVDDAAGSHTEGYGEVLSVAHAPDAPPAAAPAAPVEEEATAPRPAEMERGPAAADEVQPGAGGARGSIEFLGRWNEKYYHNERAMPVKMWGEEYHVRPAFSKFVDELVQNGAPSGTFVMTSFNSSALRPPFYVSWSASPEDKSYQRHGFAGMAPQGIIDSRLVLVRQGSPNVLRFDHWQALQAGGAAPLTCHASNPGNGGIGKMYPEERRFQEWRYTESKCVAAQDACRVQLVQGKFLKRVDADLVLDVAFWKFHEGTAVNWVGGGSHDRTYLHGGGRDFRVNSDGTICLVNHPHLCLGVIDFENQAPFEGMISAKSIAGAWICCCFPLMCTALFNKTADGDHKIVHSGCLLNLCIPFTEPRQRVPGTNGFVKSDGTDPTNVDYYTSPNCVWNGPSCSCKLA